MRRSGSYDRLCVVQKVSLVTDASGTSETWTQFARRWARLEPLSGNARFVASQVETDITHEMEMDYLPGITPEMRVLVPRYSTKLAAALTTTDGTGITVDSADGFPSSGSYIIRIESELMVVSAGAGTTSWTVSRGQYGTTAATHAQGKSVEEIVVLEVEHFTHQGREKTMLTVNEKTDAHT